MALLDVILGYDCNVACDYCTITVEMRARSLSTAQVVSAMRSARGDGFEAVAFTGGEPTIRPDLLGLVAAARSLGFSDIKVQTNGLLLAEARNLARLLAAGVTRVHVSIHTHRADRYERMVRRDGTYDRMTRALAGLAARPEIELVADVILTSETHRDLPDAIDWLASHGVRNVDLWFVSLTDGNRENLASMPRMTDVVPSLHEAFARADARQMRVRSLHVPPCLLGSARTHAFDPSRDLGHARVKVRTPDDAFELEGSKLTPSLHVPACDGCPDRATCRGLRPDYLERYGDAEVALARGTTPTRAAHVGLPLAPRGDA